MRGKSLVGVIVLSLLAAGCGTTPPDGAVKAAGIPTVVVLVSGRPLTVTEHLPAWDALVAAWLPGTEGQGVADVLFGDYKPTGKLPLSWPRTNDQIPINVGDPQYDPLFPFGFGLSY